MSLFRWVKRYWFMAGLITVCLMTLADSSGRLAFCGRWVKEHHGPDLVIIFIFLFSGLSLRLDPLRRGGADLTGICLAEINIFIVAPVVAAMFGWLPLDRGVMIGLFLVAVMPSTLSSGVVMTAAAGGNAAHALMITILANSLAVVTIPHVLSLLLLTIGKSVVISIDKGAIMRTIGLLVLLPLIIGMLLSRFLSRIPARADKGIHIVNQCLILFMVWVGFSQARERLIHSGATVGLIVLLVFFYHGCLLVSGWGWIRLSKRKKGQRESILLMGGQKTLPLSIILQVSLFPQYGLALIVCVLHHIVHLMMDGYLVEHLKTFDA